MAQSIEPVAFDGDGDIGIIAGNGSYVGSVYAFVNTDGKGAFAQIKLLERDNYNQAGHVIAADVAGDKHIDVLAESEHATGSTRSRTTPRSRPAARRPLQDRIERIQLHERRSLRQGRRCGPRGGEGQRWV